jgi:predicted MFS family arabinose efflux permease
MWFAFTLGLAVLGARHGRGAAFLATGMTAYGVGSVLGTLAVLRLLGRLPVSYSIAVAWGLTGGCWAVMGLFPDQRVIAVAAFVSGLAVVVGNTGVTAQITRASAGAERRTLMAGQSVVVNAASSLGLLAGGPALSVWGPRPTLQAAGGVLVLVAAGCVMATPWLSGEALGHLDRTRAVATPEQAGVDQQRVELVDADAVGPAVGQR